MSFQDIIKNSILETMENNTLSTASICITLGIAILFCIYIYAVYYLSQKKGFYNKQFNIVLGVLPVITAGIILAMQSNLVISLGMVGALSIVRFRAAIKEPLEIAFLFWAIAVGIVLAAGLIVLAVIGSAVIGLILIVFVNRRSWLDPYIVVLRCDGAESEREAADFLKKSVTRCSVKSKTVQPGSVELNVEVRMKGESTDFINALAALPGVQSAVLVSYNGEYMG